MKEQETVTQTQTTEKLGFFKRLVDKMDQKMKVKADQQPEQSCCSGSDSDCCDDEEKTSKGGKCC